MYRSTLSQRQVLRSSPLFARLGDEETDHILAHARVAKYAAGDQIMVKGDPGDSMMAVLNGRVSISAPSPDGRHVVLSMLRKNQKSSAQRITLVKPHLLQRASSERRNNITTANGRKR